MADNPTLAREISQWARDRKDERPEFTITTADKHELVLRKVGERFMLHLMIVEKAVAHAFTGKEMRRIETRAEPDLPEVSRVPYAAAARFYAALRAKNAHVGDHRRQMDGRTGPEHYIRFIAAPEIETPDDLVAITLSGLEQGFADQGPFTIWTHANPPSVTTLPAGQDLTPPAALQTVAAGAFESGFRFTVRGTGQDEHRFYLNSEADYRDPACITIRASKALKRELLRKFGTGFPGNMAGRTVRVAGVLRPVRIKVTAGPGMPPVSFYHQHHIEVVSVDQFEVSDNI